MVKKIWYAGVECEFVAEYNDIDVAQTWINWYQKAGSKACCLHEGGKHQLYVGKEGTK